MPDVRLIDANALENVLHEKVKTLADENGWHDHYVTGFDDAITYVEDAPTIDAVQVVRCRECKYRGYDACPMCHDEYTYDEDDGGDYFTVDNTTDDGFCHMGAKMDGGADDGCKDRCDWL